MARSSTKIGKCTYCCAALGCSNIYYTKIVAKDYVNKRFFRFPKKEDIRREKWFQIMGLPSTGSRVHLCEDHFADKMFTDSAHTRLSKFALPFDVNVKQEI